MIISLIAAASENNVLGKDNKLLWHLPADLKFFKETTSGHTVVMGRKTFESIGRALPKRRNIIITRDHTFSAEGCETANSLEAAVRLCEGEAEVFIVGGGQIYRACLPLADKIYLTRVHHFFEGDTFFPLIPEAEWNLIKSDAYFADEKNPYNYSILIYEKRNQATLS